jgi:GNAT superfamily N-acetyltransferase
MIRRATVDDIRPIYEMIEAYFHEAIEKRNYPLGWDRERVVIYLGNLLWKETGLNFVSENNEGVVLGEMMATWFGGDLMGSPAALYVKPEHRNGLIARALFRRFEQEARAQGAIAISWDFWAGVSDNKMIDGMLKRLGYQYQGAIYYKIFDEVSHGSVDANLVERGRESRQ